MEVILCGIGGKKEMNSPLKQKQWFYKKLTYWRRWLLLHPLGGPWNTKSPLQPAKAESLQEQQQLLCSTKLLCITREVFVSGSALDGDSCVSPTAADIQQLTGYSKQTLSDRGLTDRQISLAVSQQLSTLSVSRLHGTFWPLSTVQCTSDLCFKGGKCSAQCFLLPLFN